MEYNALTSMIKKMIAFFPCFIAEGTNTEYGEGGIKSSHNADSTA